MRSEPPALLAVASDGQASTCLEVSGFLDLIEMASTKHVESDEAKHRGIGFDRDHSPTRSLERPPFGAQIAVKQQSKAPRPNAGAPSGVQGTSANL
jgi:hypothetical protein